VAPSSRLLTAALILVLSLTSATVGGPGARADDVGQTPTASPTPEATPSPTPDPTASPTPGPTASPTPDPTPTVQQTSSPTEPTSTPSPTPIKQDPAGGKQRSSSGAIALADPGNATISGHVNSAAWITNPLGTNSVGTWILNSSGTFNNYTSAPIDLSGNFTITGLTAGNYTVFFSFVYFNPDSNSYTASNQFWGGGVSPSSATFFTVAQSQNYVLPSPFSPLEETSITGKVVNSANNPLQGYIVAYDATSSTAKNSSFATSAKIRPDGTYTLMNVPLGNYKIGFTVGPLNPMTTSTGALAPSSGGYKSEYWDDAQTYSTATTIALTSAGASGINGIMGFGWASPPPAAPWLNERVGGSNPAETNCECGQGDPVSSATGEYYDRITDLAVPGVGPEFALTRSYSSALGAVDSSFGYGWSSLLDSKVRITDAGTGSQPQSVEVVQENGSVVPFTLDSGNNYVAPNARALATLNWSGYQWTFTRRGVEIIKFDADGLLLSIQDLNGNTIDAEWDSGHIVNLYASGARTISFTWSGGHVASITDSASRSASYNYNVSGELTAVTGIDTHVTSYGYTASHQINTITLSGGATTTNVYDGSGRVTSQTDPIGRITTFDYAGDTTTVTSPGGAKVRDRYYMGLLVSQIVGADTTAAAITYYYYDDSGNLNQRIDPLNRTTQLGYDIRGNVTSETVAQYTQSQVFNASNSPTWIQDRMGRITTLSYDAHGNLLSVTNPAAHIQSWTRNPDGTAATSTDGDGKVTTYSYDSAGRLLSTTDPLGHSTSVTYDLAGRVVSATDGLGKVTIFTVDAYGRTSTVKDPNNHTTTYTYDVRGNQTSMTDARSKTVSATFNLADEITSSTDALLKVTTFTYTPDGYRWQTTDPNGRITANAYDARGNLISTTDPANHTALFQYDLAGQKTKTTLPSGSAMTAVYNTLGFLTSTTDALGAQTTYVRNADGTVANTSDPLGRTTVTTYLADGRISTIKYPNTNTEKYVFDGRGNVTMFTNADGLITTYVYDDGGRLTSKTEPGSFTTSYTYDNSDRLATSTRPNGSVVTSTHDNAGQLVTTHDSTSGSVDVTYVYDAAGERTGMTDATGTSSWAYSARGEVASATNGSGAAIAYAYDDAGQLTTMTYPGSKVVTYTYDTAGNMATVKDWNNKTTSFTWTADDLLSTQTTPDTLVDTRAYDLDHRLLSLTSKKGATQVAKYSYTYDTAGQLITDTTADPTTASLAHTYTYDTVNQLKSTKTGSTTLTYTATPGNELTKAASGEILTYNTSQQLTKIQPTTGAATTYVYNTNGARTSSTVAAAGSTPAATTTMTYTAAGALASVVVPGSSGGTVTYTTNGDGLRQARTKSGTTTAFLWNTNTAVSQLLTDGSQWYIYGPNTTPIAQIDKTSGTTLYLHSDLLGSVRLITTAAGVTGGANTYDPFGKRTVHTGTSDSAIGFTGAWTDSLTGLVYLRARDYDPKSYQFMVIDPAVDLTRDPYAYVSNNPLLATDPLGLWDFNDDFLYPALTTGITGQITNGLVGFGDGASFGLTHLITNALFPDVVCQITKSGSYVAGNVIGAVATTVATAGTAGVGAVAGVSRAGELYSAAEAGSVASRAGEIHGVLDSVAASMRTTAMLKTTQGASIAAGGGRDLIAAQKAALTLGEIAAPNANGVHAEMTALAAAAELGLTPSVMGVTRIICPSCQAAIENSGGVVLTSLLGAVWK
jgi:RHS repeat-associated protein